VSARRRRNRQRGVALIAVLIALAITLAITNEFGSSTNVDLIAAANYQRPDAPHFLARSAVNLSELVNPRPAADGQRPAAARRRDPDHRLRRIRC